ncbi:hypothetical protein [Pantoea coffeiphila]|uniref:hypothetical protein n=1 Tax=Pantoea coffeiphila TaxID=1465635 RepID=UPI00195F8FFC|nr:hypothetical protein [Pantoea coffeiphila]MBM7346199.1 hypothetical protein [Pantoea coffeiphila]
MRGIIIKAKDVEIENEKRCYLVRFSENEYAVLFSPNTITFSEGSVLHDEKGYWLIENYGSLQVSLPDLVSKDEAEKHFSSLNGSKDL